MARVFVGNLPIDIREREVEDLFYKYGRIRHIDLKTPSRPPAFAFVTFDDTRDAEDAIRGRDGYNFDGARLRVEMSRGERSRNDRRYDDRGSGRTRGGGRRTDFGVVVTGLPRSCSWQDLKDFMRKAGDVVYADVDHNGDGVVEFSNREDMERAVDKLDDEEFRGNSGSSYIRVRLANKRGGGSRDRSRDRDRRRSPSRSHSRSRSRSRSRDRDTRDTRRDDEDNGRDENRGGGRDENDDDETDGHKSSHKRDEEDNDHHDNGRDNDRDKDHDDTDRGRDDDA